MWWFRCWQPLERQSWRTAPAFLRSLSVKVSSALFIPLTKWITLRNTGTPQTHYWINDLQHKNNLRNNPVVLWIAITSICLHVGKNADDLAARCNAGRAGAGRGAVNSNRTRREHRANLALRRGHSSGTGRSGQGQGSWVHSCFTKLAQLPPQLLSQSPVSFLTKVFY